MDEDEQAYEEAIANSNLRLKCEDVLRNAAYCMTDDFERTPYQIAKAAFVEIKELIENQNQEKKP